MMTGESLAHWWKSRFGVVVAENEASALADFWGKVNDDYLLTLGDRALERLVAQSQIENQIFLSPDLSLEESSSRVVMADYDALPIAPESIPLVLLPHVLEFSRDPYQVLREVEIILAPYGYVILTGFNPWSGLGLRRLFSLRKRKPWSGKFRSAGRVRDWLRLLNLNIVDEKVLFYIPILQNKHLRKMFGWVDWIGKLLFPFFGGVYILIAQKKRVGMITQRMKWHELAGVVHNGFVEPATRGAHHEQSS